MLTTLLLATVVGAMLATALIRRWALHHDLLDRPNERSSHVVPTPRGGGVAIVLCFAAALGAMAILDPASRPLAWLMAPGAAVAWIGFLDDRRAVPARWRFLVHVLASCGVVLLLGGVPPLTAFGRSFELGWTGSALAVIFMVWMTNLYNFMDGIDALAGIQAITVSLGAALCWYLTSNSPLPFAFVALAAAVAGFLFWNFPPAKIFMGDAGSGFLGFALSAMALWSAQQHASAFWCWFILTGCFMVDATTTLVRRVRRGEKFYEAHRSHAYQYASRRLGSHRRVSLAVGAINLFWLLPWAMLVATGRLDGAVATAVAYAPLIWLAFRYKAGHRSAQEI